MGWNGAKCGVCRNGKLQAERRPAVLGSHLRVSVGLPLCLSLCVEPRRTDCPLSGSLAAWEPGQLPGPLLGKGSCQRETPNGSRTRKTWLKSVSNPSRPSRGWIFCTKLSCSSTSSPVINRSHLFRSALGLVQTDADPWHPRQRTTWLQSQAMQAAALCQPGNSPGSVLARHTSLHDCSGLWQCINGRTLYALHHLTPNQGPGKSSLTVFSMQPYTGPTVFPYPPCWLTPALALLVAAWYIQNTESRLSTARSAA